MSSIRRSIAFSTAASLVAPIGSLAVQPMLALGLGVTGRGEVAAALAPLLLANAAATFGIPESLTYSVARFKILEKRLVVWATSALLGSGLLVTGLVAISAEFLAGGDAFLAFLISMTSLWIAPSLILAGLRGIASGRMAWERVFYEKLGTSIVRLLGIGFLLLSSHLSVRTATLVMAGALVVPALIYVLPYSKTKASPSASSQTPPTISALCSYAARVWIGSLAGILLMRLDQLLMTPLSSVRELGLYTVAASISEVALFFNGAVTGVVFASEADKADPKRVARISRISTVVTTLTSVVIGANICWALPLFFGVDFADAIPSTLILLLAVVLGNPGSVAGASLSGLGHPGLRSTAITFGLIANTTLLICLVPTLGSVGAALATLAGNVLAGNLNIVFNRKLTGTPLHAFYAFRLSDFQSMFSMIRRRHLS
ncbi:oligosaccharide flippase family protein [Pseudoclavibacter sp. CFCC 13796]|uniref:polysaccharide biosynthesis C-terminal domain-containing protein n=1 Tax=Pseudoclavibacter sp. CFCC 13796 TaxID=2615179 RepID=UPI001300E2A7|nr:polysaccharide biosynthesis C-terminal domain-containing protein [Pseudoclavibacter sp. CFCC 13796]KAB1661086.1 oligosaccharide flippase family protein [Pseudoclavibacter sp. CFCC 13796]